MENTPSISDIIDCEIEHILSTYKEPFIPLYNSKNTNKKILVLSGGGIKGITFLGGIKALEELQIIQHIDTFAGTSVGSIISFLLTIGYSANEMFKFIKQYNFDTLKDISITLLLGSYGLDSGEKILDMIRKLMKIKNIDPSITLEQLFNLTKKIFIATSVNVNTQCAEYFSYKTHPSSKVIDVIRMSISIPFIFTPFKFNDNFYVDGGCMDNFPIEQFKNRMDEVIGICIIEKKIQSNISGIDDYALKIISSLMNGVTNSAINHNYNNVITINIDGIDGIGMEDFNITQEKKKKLYKLGYDTVHEYNKKQLLEIF